MGVLQVPQRQGWLRGGHGVHQVADSGGEAHPEVAQRQQDPGPYNVELQFVQETWSKKQIKEEKGEIVTLQEQDQDFETLEADFEKALLPTASSAHLEAQGPAHQGTLGQ